MEAERSQDLAFRQCAYGPWVGSRFATPAGRKRLRAFYLWRAELDAIPQRVQREPALAAFRYQWQMDVLAAAEQSKPTVASGPAADLAGIITPGSGQCERLLACIETRQAAFSSGGPEHAVLAADLLAVLALLGPVSPELSNAITACALQASVPDPKARGRALDGLQPHARRLSADHFAALSHLTLLRSSQPSPMAMQWAIFLAMLRGRI